MKLSGLTKATDPPAGGDYYFDLRINQKSQSDPSSAQPIN
jgi:hypothetical protein